MIELDCVATSSKGFIQQIVSGWVRNGYYFYVEGTVPAGKDPQAVDHKLITRYGIEASKGKRYARKQRGLANLAYLRHERNWIMLATRGEHRWFSEERQIKNCRRGQPIQFYGYSISYVRGGYVLNRKKANPDGPRERDAKHRVRVQISRQSYRELKAELVGSARNRREEWFAAKFWNLPFEPYAPIRKQQLELLRLVNAARKSAGLSKLSPEIIRYKQDRVRVFV
jgi:hypothetical protein